MTQQGYITQNRQPIIIDMLTNGSTHQQIADKLNIDRKTVERDINAWFDSDGFKHWLYNEFIELHHLARSSDKLTLGERLAYQTVASLIRRGGIEVNVLHQTANLTTIKVVFGEDKPKSQDNVQEQGTNISGK